METSDKKIILIAGGSGFIGKRLSKVLHGLNYKVCFLTRSKTANGKDFFNWDPEKKVIDESAIKIADVIINLAGENIGESRWTAGRKRKIVNSRIFSTNLLYESLAKIPNKVKLVINASAIGYYGNTGDLIMNEESPASTDFMALTCKRWEEAAHNFNKLNIRTVIVRIGLVLAPEAGVFPEMMKPIKFGFAPYFGNGKQYQSWIHIDDLCKIFEKCVRDSKMNGTYNAVAPGPLSNKNFMKLITQIMSDKILLVRIPAIFMMIAFGEKAKLLLHGSRVSSKKIEAAGFTFAFPQAGAAIRNILGK